MQKNLFPYISRRGIKHVINESRAAFIERMHDFSRAHRIDDIEITADKFRITHLIDPNLKVIVEGQVHDLESDKAELKLDAYSYIATQTPLWQRILKWLLAIGTVAFFVWNIMPALSDAIKYEPFTFSLTNTQPCIDRTNQRPLHPAYCPHNYRQPESEVVKDKPSYSRLVFLIIGTIVLAVITNKVSSYDLYHQQRRSAETHIKTYLDYVVLYANRKKVR